MPRARMRRAPVILGTIVALLAIAVMGALAADLLTPARFRLGPAI